MAVPLFNLAPDLAVSRLCLGTMTFGEQNTLPQSFQLLDKAFHAGINFFDSAEMYAVPQRADTQGRSEEYLPQSCYVPMFGETEYDPTRNYSFVTIEEQLAALNKAIDDGKIRYIGLSNETPYGLMKFQHIAEGVFNGSRFVSVQNFYNLLCRNFDLGMAECCHHERVSLLAYSPLAMGILSGKYLSLDGGPADARLNLFRGRYAEGESGYNLSNGVINKSTELRIKT